MNSSLADSEPCQSLASYRHCADRINSAWPKFLANRAARLQAHPLLGDTPEKSTENILEELFTQVLDWSLCDFVFQVDHADVVLVDHGIRRLIIETKRPGSLAWNRGAVVKALDQALRYAADQKVKSIAVSDGIMLYAADVHEGGIRDRVFIALDQPLPPLDLWWLSVQGIYRNRESAPEKGNGLHQCLLPEESSSDITSTAEPFKEGPLLHPKYKLPARCFAYVGNYNDPHTWKLPYLLFEGAVDTKRLPKAIQSILSNYRGVKVSGIPESAIPSTLERLARAAAQAGHLPPRSGKVAPTYHQLVDALDQLGITYEEAETV